MSGFVRRSRVSVATCSARSGQCRDVFGEVRFLSGHDRRGRLMSRRDRRDLVSMGKCSARSAYCRNVFDEVSLLSGQVRQGFVNDRTCPQRSA